MFNRHICQNKVGKPVPGTNLYDFFELDKIACKKSRAD